MTRATLLMLALACGRPDDRAAAPATETSSVGSAPAIATADTATVEVPLSLPSQLYVEHDATIYARSSGVVESIVVDIGSRVAPGQPLARLESADQRIALAQAEERLKNATQSVERQRALTVAGVVTQADSERVELEHREAVLALRKAQRDLDLTRIVAPFAGVVTSRMARLHRLVEAGDSLFRVTALSPVLAAVHVPEANATSFRIGTEAEIVGLGGVTSKARIIRASPVIDAASGTREMILQLAGATRLVPGSSVTVRLGSEPRNVVTIPKTAVDEEGYALVWADERTTLRALTLGSDIPGDRIEVVRGLSPGEKVVRTAP
ncbi:MAG TPA: efflux RND transporter periplasmic adaptor subunit [Gemmatimonadales bacterium]|nr:efflux RND transporter periplasmic adaptor subunit [Gemmatimonadales bacterium]